MASMNPLNSILRFAIEMATLVTYGVWGYHLSESWTGILWAVFLPVGFAVLWGVFAVRNDPSRSGKTIVPTPGWVRLLMELGFFTAAAWMLFDLDRSVFLWIYAGSIILHHLISYKRIHWLIRQ